MPAVTVNIRVVITFGSILLGCHIVLPLWISCSCIDIVIPVERFTPLLQKPEGNKDGEKTESILDCTADLFLQAGLDSL